MAYSKSTTKHNVAFPSKIRSGGDGHVLNIVVDGDTDNGVIASVGAWKDFDRYDVEAGNAGFEGVLHAAANGNWYVEVTQINAAKPPVFLYNAPIVEDQTLNYGEEYFFNEDGDTVKGYVLGLYDIFEESAAIFTGTPAEGATVTVSGSKLVVA
jgi:hypothetical protein